MLKLTIIRRTYIPDDDMLDSGEIEYNFVDRYDEEFTLTEFINFLKKKGQGSWEASQYPVNKGTWLESDGVTNYTSYEHEELTIHNTDGNKSERWLKYLKAAQNKGLI